MIPYGYGRVLERSERAVTEPDAEAVMRIRLCAVSWMAHRLALSSARFSQAALKFAGIDLWGRSEPGNTHLILVERERRAGILHAARTSNLASMFLKER